MNASSLLSPAKLGHTQKHSNKLCIQYHIMTAINNMIIFFIIKYYSFKCNNDNNNNNLHSVDVYQYITIFIMIIVPVLFSSHVTTQTEYIFRIN